MIKSYEGYEANFYIDAVGIKTIGYGHACHVFDCSNLQAKNSAGLRGKSIFGNVFLGTWRQVKAPLSTTDAADLLRGDLDKGGYEQCVRDAVTASVTDNEFSALVSFVFKYHPLPGS
jgi:lysozyme